MAALHAVLSKASGGTVSLRALEMAAQVRPDRRESFGRANQVTQQIEAAISIGLINSGERLPPEAIMAEQMGVSPLTLRQSLAVLRSKGLLETRRGKGGGSYITGTVLVPEAELARELWSRKTEDLRELIDLAASLTGSAARLASTRSDEQDQRRIRGLAERFAQAPDDPSALRRADARFHIGLGVAAQSKRLTDLLVQVQAELAPLMWGSEWLDKARQEAIESHSALVSAIERGSAREAEELAIAHYENEGALIIDQRLRLITENVEARQ